MPSRKTRTRPGFPAYAPNCGDARFPVVNVVMPGTSSSSCVSVSAPVANSSSRFHVNCSPTPSTGGNSACAIGALIVSFGIFVAVSPGCRPSTVTLSPITVSPAAPSIESARVVQRVGARAIVSGAAAVRGTGGLFVCTESGYGVVSRCTCCARAPGANATMTSAPATQPRRSAATMVSVPSPVRNPRRGSRERPSVPWG